MRRVFWILLAIFLIIFGVLSVSNIEVEWGRPIMGFSALAAGICAAILGFTDK